MTAVGVAFGLALLAVAALLACLAAATFLLYVGRELVRGFRARGYLAVHRKPRRLTRAWNELRS